MIVVSVEILLFFKLIFVFELVWGEVCYWGVYGGRGLGKLFLFVFMVVVWGVVELICVFCIREF